MVHSFTTNGWWKSTAAILGDFPGEAGKLQISPTHIFHSSFLGGARVPACEQRRVQQRAAAAVACSELMLSKPGEAGWKEG